MFVSKIYHYWIEEAYEWESRVGLNLLLSPTPFLLTTVIEHMLTMLDHGLPENARTRSMSL